MRGCRQSAVNTPMHMPAPTQFASPFCACDGSLGFLMMVSAMLASFVSFGLGSVCFFGLLLSPNLLQKGQ